MIFLNHNNNNSTNDDDTYNLQFFDDHNEQMLVIEGEIRKFVFFAGRRFWRKMNFDQCKFIDVRLHKH